MTKHRSHSVAFKRQVAEEFIAGETLHRLSKQHDISALRYGSFAVPSAREDYRPRRISAPRPASRPNGSPASRRPLRHRPKPSAGAPRKKSPHSRGTKAPRFGGNIGIAYGNTPVFAPRRSKLAALRKSQAVDRLAVIPPADDCGMQR
jgi:hypothetical protein